MYESYSGRRQNNSAPRSGRRTISETSKSKLLHFGNLFLKQTAAAVVCAAVVYGMHAAKTPGINRCAEALGRALRYESDLSIFSDAGESLSRWLRSKFPASAPDPAAVPETTIPDVPEPETSEITVH